MEAETIPVEVAYAKPDEQLILSLQVHREATVEDAIQQSGIKSLIPGIDIQAIGIFGKCCKPDQKLRAHDRIEIYRPLLLDPKESRRIRAQKHP